LDYTCRPQRSIPSPEGSWEEEGWDGKERSNLWSYPSTIQIEGSPNRWEDWGGWVVRHGEGSRPWGDTRTRHQSSHPCQGSRERQSSNSRLDSTSGPSCNLGEICSLEEGQSGGSRTYRRTSTNFQCMKKGSSSRGEGWGSSWVCSWGHNSSGCHTKIRWTCTQSC